MGKKIAVALVMVVILVVLLVGVTRCSRNDKVENVENTKINTVKETEEVEKTEKEISYNYDDFVIKITVPAIVENGKEVTLYKFQKEAPKDKGYNKGSFFLKGDELLLGFATTNYFHQNDEAFITKNGTKSPTFEDFMNFIQTKEYTGAYKNPEMVKIGDRDAARFELRYGAGDNNLKGYKYVINLDDILKDEFLELIITPVNSKTSVIEDLMEKDEIKEMIDSMVFFE